MLKSRGWRTHLIILRGRCWIIDFLLDVRHCPVIPNHAFHGSVRHHADLSEYKEKKRIVSEIAHTSLATSLAIADTLIVITIAKAILSARIYEISPVAFSLQSKLHFFFASAIFKHGQRLEHF